ncbi:MAG: hypothetical protein KDE46_11795 [Caldilineaceae bacterium]|nr:hypothetical protein [Caldilineaceae bacterium]
MKTYQHQKLFVLLGLCAALVLAAMIGAGRLRASALALVSAPSLVNYQGHLRDSGGNPYTGQAALKFTIYDADTGGNNLWTETYLSVPVNAGNFALKLGSVTPLSASVFDGTGRYLQLSVDLTNTDSNYTDFPRQQFTSVPYAFQADSVSWSGITDMPAGFADGIDDTGSANYENVIIVAKSGGHYTTITDAMNAISPASDNRYLVWVAPGLYEEQVTVKPYVHLKGAGMAVTQISSKASGSHTSSAAATVAMQADSQLSDVEVANISEAQDGVAIYIGSGNSNTRLFNVKALANGAGGDRHDGLFLNGGSATLEHVYAQASGAGVGNWGIFNSASSPTLDSVTLMASGGGSANALRLNGGSPIIENSTLKADQSAAAYGVEGTGAGAHTVRFDHSVIDGEDFGIRLSSGNYTVYVGASLVQGGGNAFAGTIRCVASYKADYTAVNTTCN